MYCPKCGKKTAVTDSRAGNEIVIRIRKCKCGFIFKTAEYIDQSMETEYEYRELKREAMEKHVIKRAKENVK